VYLLAGDCTGIKSLLHHHPDESTDLTLHPSKDPQE
jgi:hypothetical protein